ncbi:MULTISPECIES: ComEA family DNA-binding protein [Pseudoxanthomonas]|jgi:competence protein ComEA|uniref:Competence protein ComEA n=1 Tax=Pseudoxanthomonas winnipegensis TaxID=2480810 RepID=A0A4Q9TFE0_9GAMM|nr:MULTISPECIES: helix-hairpin-helix domain-containing protein [Pseudoxanthomonas]MDQ1118526.1 competence protein ComEA [Pseudoxanthomonas winnipegensis]MDQ1131710.1 competence protein ComEA [Pseudoxanthomonas winnipegensis]MDR6138271.1 competence protein ComEA [Pseudoxanthomonas sp. SORGH_AS_0997]RZZ86686.1 competence protein ComEA [Pseudoxanthomonas winnipegensis]TAA08114.1 competence protein ComEA [Pseudoxanthomonas winnipegensis]
MKPVSILIKSLILSLALSAGAFAAESRVNINTADAAALDATLLNVGASKAQAIVDYRKANGPFKSAEELAMVKGIGLKTVEKNRDRIEVGRSAAAPKRPSAAAAPAKPVTRR